MEQPTARLDSSEADLPFAAEIVSVGTSTRRRASVSLLHTPAHAFTRATYTDTRLAHALCHMSAPNAATLALVFPTLALNRIGFDFWPGPV